MMMCSSGELFLCMISVYVHVLSQFQMYTNNIPLVLFLSSCALTKILYFYPVAFLKLTSVQSTYSLMVSWHCFVGMPICPELDGLAGA